MNHLLIFAQEEFENPLVTKYVLLFATIFLILLVVYRIYLSLEYRHASIHKKPFFNHIYLWLTSLPKEQLSVLKKEFKFYQKLTPKYQSYFEHRVNKFINNKEFIGKDNLEVTDRMKVLVAATATMITFGYRDYKIRLIDRVLLYPKVFFSNTNKEYHKGEFNPAFKAIVFSWEDFLHGYEIDNDNLNLGIHEFIHALHISCLKKKGITAIIFFNTFLEITEFLEKNEDYKERLVASEYLRDYAYTNHFEFISVIIETFIETPHEFKSQFPEIYAKVKGMLNFNFSGY